MSQSCRLYPLHHLQAYFSAVTQDQSEMYPAAGRAGPGQPETTHPPSRPLPSPPQCVSSSPPIPQRLSPPLDFYTAFISESKLIG